MTEEVKPKSKMWIIGVNLGVMVLYSIICFAQGSEGLIAMWVIMLTHVAISFVVGIGAAVMSQYQNVALPWILTSIIILLIGLSTCFMAVSGLGHM